MAIRLMNKLLLSKKEKSIVFIRKCQSITGIQKADDILMKVTRGRITGWVEVFSQVSGQTDVRRAQDGVLQAEKIFQQKQDDRRTQARKLGELQSLLHQATKERETANRGTELYLKLLTRENELFCQENAIKTSITVLEEEERDSFSKMSSSLRASQEIERFQARRAQHFSYFLSIAGVLLGGVISLMISERRMRRLHTIVSSSTNMADDYKSVMGELREHVQHQQDKMVELVKLQHDTIGKHDAAGEQTPSKVQQQGTSTEQCIQEILDSVKNQEVILDREISELKKMYGSELAQGNGGGVVYVGPEMKDILKDTEKNLEWKMKLTALASATFVYSAVVLTLPVIYILFKGTGGS